MFSHGINSNSNQKFMPQEFFMIAVFCFLSLWHAFFSQLIELKTVNQQWSSPSFTVTNLIENVVDISSLTTKIFPGIQSNLISQISYKNISSSTILKPTFQYNIPINVRVDTNSSILIYIGFYAQPNPSVSITANVCLKLRYRQKQVIFTYGRSYFDNTAMANFSAGNKYGSYFYRVNQQDNIQIHQDNSSLSYQLSIDIVQILRKLCKFINSPLSCNEQVTSLYYYFNIVSSNPQQSGDISFNTSISSIYNCTSSSFQQSMNNFLLVHKTVGGLAGWGDVCRLSNNLYIPLFRFDYNYEVNYDGLKPLCPKENASTFLYRGKYSQLSQDSDFPILITEKTILSSLNVLMDATYGTVVAEVCFVAVLRNDYDPQTKTFGNNPESEGQINICRWSNVHIYNTRQRWVQIEGSSYAYYNYSTERKHFFVDDENSLDLSQPKILQKWDLNISKFVENVTELSNHRIVAVKRGFRVYCGKVNFIIQGQSFGIILNPKPVTPNLSNTSNASNKSIQLKGSNLANLSNTPNFPISNSTRISDTVKQVVSNAASVPNIGLVLRLAQLFNTFDDLSYFIYHNTTYDVAFTYVADLSWGWTHSKWLPPSPIRNNIGINLSSGSQPGWVPFRQAIARFRVKGQRMAFLDNCKGFLFYTIPTSLILFLPLWKLYWKFRHFKGVVVISTFSSWAYLAISLICDNGQYLAFRGFEQLRSLHSTSYSALLSEVLAVIALFIATFCSSGLLLLFHSSACPLFKPPTLLRAMPSYKFFAIWTVSRFLAGYVHATIDDPLMRICLLLGLQLIVFISTLASWHCTRFKTPHTALIFGQVIRLTLYLLICLEVLFPELAGPYNGNGLKISDISQFLMQILFVATALQIIMAIIVGIWVKPKDFNFKLNHLFNQKKKKNQKIVVSFDKIILVHVGSSCKIDNNKPKVTNHNSDVRNLMIQSPVKHKLNQQLKNKIKTNYGFSKKPNQQIIIKKVKA